jgi:hypothetical protein
MHWNHRVARHVTSLPGGGTRTWYAIHEAFYGLDGEGTVKLTDEPKAIIGETLADIRETLQMMLRALDTPIIDARESSASKPP